MVSTYLRKGDIEILDSSDYAVPVKHSSTIYFRGYPYRVEFANQTFDTKRSLRDFRREVEDFVDDFSITGIRTHISKKQQRFYFDNKPDLGSFVGMYHSVINDIRGPIDDAHLDLLLHPDVDIEIRNTHYFKQYNAKVYCMRKFNRQYRMGFFHKSYSNRLDELTEAIKDVAEFVNDNMDIKLVSYNPYSTNFFCDYDELINLMPFIKLNIDEDMILKITKSLVEDK